MRRMLRSFATGDFCTQTIIEKRSPEHQKASDTAFTVCWSKWRKKLNSEEKELLKKRLMRSQRNTVTAKQTSLSVGFRLGAILILEILETRREFLFRVWSVI